MRIIINQGAYYLPKGKWFFHFIHNMLFCLANCHPGYQYFYLSSGNNNPDFSPQKISLINISTPFFIPFFLKKLWYKQKTKSIARSLKPGMVLSLQGNILHAAKKEYVIVLNDEISADELKGGYIFITTVSLKESLQSKYKIAPSRIKVLTPLAGEEYVPLDFDGMHETMAKFTDGKEYFLFDADGSEEDMIIDVLKAFSIFKKWQLSNTRLLLINAELNKKVHALLQAYKYRNEVNIVENVQHDHSSLIGAATAVIYLPVVDEFGLPLAKALCCEVPVITANHEPLKEIGGDAVLYINPRDPKDLSDKMMKIFKDEKLRNQLLQKTREQLQLLKSESAFDL